MNMLDNENLAIEELTIRRNEKDGYKVSAKGLYKSEECEINIPHVNNLSLIINRQGIGYNFEYNLNIRSRINAEDEEDRLMSVTIPRISELRNKVDELNCEAKKLEDEFGNIFRI